jgi:hypothetical protein
VLNAVARLIMGGHLTTTLVESLPVPTWTGDRRDRWIAAAARRLGRAGRHDRLAGRLQARVAHRFGLAPGDFRRILDRFPLIGADRREEAWAQFQSECAAKPQF